MQTNAVVSRDHWIAARQQLMAKEKAMTRLRDQLSQERRKLPWIKVEEEYVFDAPGGKRTLGDLFVGRSQLIVKHFMLAPGQNDPCVGCSFESDHIQAALQHIEHHDVKFVCIARAPLADIERVKQRMGWTFDWVSSHGSDFNYDFDVSFTPEQVATGKAYYNFHETDVPIEDLSGLSIFYKDDSGDIFRTYSVFGRGGEEVMSSYVLLDMTPKGRNETGPNHDLTDWVRLHDQYGDEGHVDQDGRWRPAAGVACCAAEKK